ncbi:o-succinylbenzoate--CoA ligase [Pseudalkalibacillus caeni]|uniref:2-succinylbenzoate--CoA ligase n=1 Tax=Exobacillus caeni TaxID=2574798 RepID=A0A5R9FBF3_9BACL|nr:o-succinylbenzoate--CoA ligase [Pseudalkalibacillus caeni]TLS39008.1 o-succinylbenzoate--CoA ligase [Pseudalkalibacillus caeni]
MQVMPNWLKKRAELTPGRMAVTIGEKSLTYQMLNEEAIIMAKKLAALGVKEKDRVAVLAQNSVESVVFMHALTYLHAVLVPLNIRLSGEELAWQINDAKADFLIYDPVFFKKTEEVRKLSQVEFYSWNELNKLKEIAVPVLKDHVSLEDNHTIMYTSGTTGKPKGVVLTYGNHWWSAVSSSLNLGLHLEDRWLAATPLFHMSGLSILIRSVIYGITTVIHEKFDPQKANSAIKNEGVTIVSVVSTMLAQMLEELGESRYPESLRCMLLGGGPAPLPILENCKKRSIPVYQTFGMTETASQVVTLSSEYMLEKLGSAGKPLFPAEVKIMEDGKELPPEEAGEIIVKGPMVTKGYWKREEATAEAIKEGWLYTGDIGYLDKDGFLFILDRRSDLIISGGENIYPAEIESVLLSHPSVLEAGVAGKEDSKWGQVPVAFLVTQKDKTVTEQEVLQYAEAKLARYKVPVKAYFVEELPRNASKKLLRRKLMDLL